MARSTSVAMVGCVGLENWQNCVTDNAQTDGELHRVLGPKNKEEKAIRFTQLLNSANVRRPVGDIRAHFRNMKNHDPMMVKNMIQGDYAKSPKYILNAKSAMVSFASWWAHDKDSLKKKTDEQELENGEDAVGETAANCGTKRTYITSIIITVTLGRVKTALTNLIADGEAMFVCTIPGRELFVIILAKSLFDILMEKSTSTWFDEYNDDQQKRAFVFYAHEITECFLCNMAAAAEGFNTVSCLLLGSADNLEEKDYEKATMNIAEDILEIKKMIRKNTACVVGVKFKTLASASLEKKRRLTLLHH